MEIGDQDGSGVPRWRWGSRIKAGGLDENWGPARKLGCQMGVRVLEGGGGPGQRWGTPVSLTWQCPRRGWQRWHPRTRLSTAQQRAGSDRAFRECPAPALRHLPSCSVTVPSLKITRALPCSRRTSAWPGAWSELVAVSRPFHGHRLAPTPGRAKLCVRLARLCPTLIKPQTSPESRNCRVFP